MRSLKMRILGVDPALTVSGYGVIELKGNKLIFEDAGVIATSSKEATPIRLNKIYTVLSRLVTKIRPDVMVLEKLYAHYRHPTTAYLLGQARGVICLVSAQAGIPLVEYAATRVKKAVVGQGLASKLQVQRMVGNILDLSGTPEYTDVTDALALAITHSYAARLKNLNLKIQSEITRHKK